MISQTQYEAYFESIARKLKDISHTDEQGRFAIMDIDDILSDQRGSLDFTGPCLILENFEGQLGYKHDKIKDEAYGAFFILQTVNRNDPTEKRSVIDNSKEIGLKIIAYMQHQKYLRAKGDNTIPRMILYYDLEQVKYNKVSNVFSSCHGWRFEFNLGQEDPIYYDPNDWHLPEE